MENDILAVILYEGNTIGVRIGMESSINELRRVICEKWLDLTPLSFNLSFVRDNKRTLIETDAELQSYACFGVMKKQQTVEIFVTLNSSSKDIASSPKDVASANEEASSSTSFSLGSCVDPQPLDARPPLKSDSWANLITGVGQRFVGGAAEFRTKLLKYCVESGFKVKMVKNDSKRVTVECGKKEQTGCQWRIHASRKYNLANFFVIKMMEAQHTCGAGTKDVENPAMSSKLVKSVILDQVRERPSLKPKEIIDCFRKDYGMNLNYYFAYTGKELALKEIHGDEALSYHQLVWYTNALRESNPGSHIVLESNVETRQFERIFIAFQACIHGFNFCRPMLCVNATLLKDKYKGCLLSATAKDANEGNFLLAIAIVNAENEANWLWFLENLKLGVSDARRLTFISNRHCGLAESVPRVFPDSYHAYCLSHLKDDLTGSLSSKNSKRSFIVSLFTNCAHAATQHDFHEALQIFKEVGEKAADDFLSDIPCEHWANAYFQGNRYGEMCSNVVDSFNSWILEQRDLPITSMLDEIRLKIMKMMSDGREVVKQWNGILCPVIENKLVEKVESGLVWKVTESAEFVFEAHADRSHRVDLRSMCCSCNLWKIEGIPCEHAVRCILFTGQQVHHLCDGYFSVSSFRDCYSRSIEPVVTKERPQEIGDEAAIVPPDVKKPQGRPKKKRKENTGAKDATMCDKCKCYGHHHRSTCSQVTVSEQ